MVDVPDYLCIDDLTCTNRDILRISAEKVVFPLSDDIKKVFLELEKKFDAEPVRVGLAAPQIGYGYQVIIFEVLATPELKKFRADLTQTMPKTIWINPNYYPIDEETTTDWEACFSIKNHTGFVERYKKIHYKAMTIDGLEIEGIADGFWVRVIQHESIT